MDVETDEPIGGVYAGGAQLARDILGRVTHLPAVERRHVRCAGLTMIFLINFIQDDDGVWRFDSM